MTAQQSIASELDDIIAAFDDHRGAAALQDTFWLRSGVTVCEALHELKDRIASLEGQLRLRQAFMKRLPFCPDHRDKVAGKPCRECEIERLRRDIERGPALGLRPEYTRAEVENVLLNWSDRVLGK